MCLHPLWDVFLSSHLNELLVHCKRMLRLSERSSLIGCDLLLVHMLGLRRQHCYIIEQEAFYTLPRSHPLLSTQFLVITIKLTKEDNLYACFLTTAC